MFGYVKPEIPELKVKDYELYKAVYCGLCRTMGKCTGCMSKFTLSYDFVFLALLRMTLENVRGEVKMRRCMVHPLKKRLILETNASVEYSSRSSVILTKLKLKDNVNDSRGFAGLKAKTVNLVSFFFKKTDKNLIPLEEKAEECINKLTVLEKENTDSVDMAADTFGELLAEVASFGLEGTAYRLAYDIGMHLGRWIYVIDAFDDLKDDIKKGSFNVIVNSFGENPTDENIDSLRCALILELNAISKSVGLVDFSSHRDVEEIIKNIVYEGMRAQTDKILKFTPY